MDDIEIIRKIKEKEELENSRIDELRKKLEDELHKIEVENEKSLQELEESLKSSHDKTMSDLRSQMEDRKDKALKDARQKADGLSLNLSDSELREIIISVLEKYLEG